MESLALIGTGIAGLGAAWFLHRDYALTVFEANDYIGGHTNTVTVDEAGRSVPIDTGFMVFNHVTYPLLTRLFRELEVATKPTCMSFSVQHAASGLEYCGSSLNHLFAQRRNLLRPSFYRLLLSIARFNREAIEALADPATESLTLGEFFALRRYPPALLERYLVPMSSAVWSTPPAQMLEFPAATLLRFFHNHGFLGLHTQHPWWTVEGGAKTYVEKLTAPFRDRIHLRTPARQVSRLPRGGVEVATDRGAQRFDHVVLACHAPQALALLADATDEERQLLAPFRYHRNTALLHTDAAVMPRTPRAWSSWNYRVAADGSASTHYWMNRLQGVSDRVNYFVSLDGEDVVAPAHVLRRIEYEHPLFDLAATRAQPALPALNRRARSGTHTYFCGAWQRYGFHEDGLFSALRLAQDLLGRDPWLHPAAAPAPIAHHHTAARTETAHANG
jgi:predicted NAD/FAD-binding protein